jgi:hypothetical protein
MCSHQTGWTRLEIGYSTEVSRAPTPHIETHPEDVNASSLPSAPPPDVPEDGDLPSLAVRVLCTDVTRHLDGVHRQKGGIGSQGYDEKQKDLRSFFGGGASE